METQLWAEIWKILRAAYPDQRPSEAQIELYTRILSDLPPQTILAAVVQHVASSKWFPRVAELREIATGLLPGGDIPTVTAAYGEVQSRIADTGSYGVPEWSHPAIAKTVEAMGWRSICFSEEPDVCRSNFIRLYEIYVKRLRDETTMLPEVRQVKRELAGRGTISLPDVVKQLAESKRLN